MTQLFAFITGPAMVGLGLALLGLGLLAHALYRTGLIQKYISFWHEAARNSGEGSVSARRAVFIHGAAAGAVLVFTVLWKAGWVFTKESLSAFETFLYTTVGGFVGGQVADAVRSRMAAKTNPNQEQTP